MLSIWKAGIDGDVHLYRTLTQEEEGIWNLLSYGLEALIGFKALKRLCVPKFLGIGLEILNHFAQI